ncbi:MAG: hypothetical protein ACYSR1_01250 [Planctomycetota bacterium]
MSKFKVCSGMKTEIFCHEILRNSTIFRFLLPRPRQNDLVGLMTGLLIFVRQGIHPDRHRNDNVVEGLVGRGSSVERTRDSINY